jgi:N-acetylneuraminic acid mutarotase
LTNHYPLFMKPVYFFFTIFIFVSNISCDPKCCQLGMGSGNWAKRSRMIDVERSEAISFTIGQFTYVGTGLDGQNNSLGDFWKYDQVSDSWIQVTSLPSGSERSSAVGFSVDGYGICGTGYNGSEYLDDFYRFNPVANEWTKINSTFPGKPRSEAVAFGIGHSGYIGTGFDGTHPLADFYQYDLTTDQWTSLPFGGKPRYSSAIMVINDKAYLVTGTNGVSLMTDMWVFDPAISDSNWKSLNAIINSSAQAFDDSYTTIARSNCAAFVMGNKGYISTGQWYDTLINYTWEYDFTRDLWIEKTPFEGPVTAGATGFSINNRGYLLTGKTGINQTTQSDFLWEFQPDSEENPNDN